jgi:hypothetical protein
MQDYALSNFDIAKLLNNKIKIVTYSEIANYKTIDELLKPYNQIIILYESSKNMGHWCACWKKGKMIHMFDSYGLFIDDELKFVKNKTFKEKSNQDYPYLTKLIYDSKYELDYNDHRLQRFSSGISTCGRWCVLRLLNKNLSTDAFYHKVKEASKMADMTPDEFVTKLIHVDTFKK